VVRDINMNTKSKGTNFSLMIGELIGEARNSLLGIMTEDVYCTDDFAMLIILVADRKNIDEC
jgi:hypothetical protein